MSFEKIVKFVDLPEEEIFLGAIPNTKEGKVFKECYEKEIIPPFKKMLYPERESFVNCIADRWREVNENEMIELVLRMQLIAEKLWKFMEFKKDFIKERLEEIL